MAYLEWVMVRICLAFGRKKSIPATSQCALGQLINGNCSREGEQHSFTSLAPKDIYTSQERLCRD